MKFDSSLLGTEVHIGDMNLDLASMAIVVNDLLLENPKGGKNVWKSEYLLKADKVQIDVEGEKFVFSMGKEMLVENVHAEGVSIIYEPTLRSSNVTDFLHYLGEPPEVDGDLEVMLKKVAIKGVGLKVHVHSIGPHVELADIHFEDFAKENHGATGIMHIVHILLGTLLKSAAATAKDAVEGAVYKPLHAAEGLASAAVTSVEHDAGKAAHALQGMAASAASATGSLFGHLRHHDHKTHLA